MKRIIGLFLFVLVIMSTSAYAQDFTLHSGTTFGMTQEEVVLLEQSKGFFSDSVASEVKSNKIGTSGTFAGRDNGEMYYAFDSEGKVVQFHYSFKSGNMDDFETMNATLISKYGSPDYSSESNNTFSVELKWYPEQTEDTPIIWNGYSPITGKSLDRTRMKAFLFDLLGTKLYNYQDYTCDKYAQWLIKDKDGSAVLIDHCFIGVSAYQADNSISKKSNHTQSNYELVIYTYFDSAEMKRLDTVTSQIMDDL